VMRAYENAHTNFICVLHDVSTLEVMTIIFGAVHAPDSTFKFAPEPEIFVL